MVQIEESRQEYMKQNGIPPGVPTQKGQNIEPEITGVALPNAPLGNYDVPDGWPTPPHFNEKGDVPGPPLQWEEPEDLGNVEAGYGYKSNNEEENNIFFFHSDHLGSTSYLTDKDGNACEYVCYMPYGEALVSENNTDFENLFKFSGMELDKVTKLYNHGARQRDFWSTIWYGPDPLSEQFPMFSPYTFCNGNPVGFVDLDGMETKYFLRNTRETQTAKKYPDDKNNLIIFVHGYSTSRGVAKYQHGKVSQIDNFKKFQTQILSECDNKKVETIILVSCHSASDKNGIAQEISENLPNTKIIAPTNTVEQNTRTGELTVPNGDWVVLKAGKEIDRYDGDWQPKSEPTKSDILFDNKKMTFLEKIENIFKFNNNENDK